MKLLQERIYRDVSSLLKSNTFLIMIIANHNQFVCTENVIIALRAVTTNVSGRYHMTTQLILANDQRHSNQFS